MRSKFGAVRTWMSVRTVREALEALRSSVGAITMT
jgi:hypothetical protein